MHLNQPQLYLIIVIAAVFSLTFFFAYYLPANRGQFNNTLGSSLGNLFNSFFNNTPGNMLGASGEGGSGCFVAGTKITTLNGTKNIEDIKVGDIVATVNLTTNKIEYKKVLETDSPTRSELVKLTFDDGTENTNTFDHPYWVIGKGWSSHDPAMTKKLYNIDAEKLQIGDTVYKNVNGKLVEIKLEKIVEIHKKTQLYNLKTVESNHNYFANGILVSNKGEGPPPEGTCKGKACEGGREGITRASTTSETTSPSTSTTTPTNQAPKGFLDSVDFTSFTGWACDPDDYTKALDVQFYADGPSGTGTFLGTASANLAREKAVGDACGGNLNHGFVFNAPALVKDGNNHTIYAYAVNIPPGDNPQLSQSPMNLNSSCTNGTVPNPLPDQNCPGGYSQFANLGGALLSPPVIQNYKDLLIIAVRGADQNVWVKEWNVTASTNSTSWYLANGSVVGSLKLVIVGSTLYMYGQGQDSKIWFTTYKGPQTWANWTNLGTCNYNFTSPGPYSTSGSDGNVYNVSGSNPIVLNQCNCCATCPTCPPCTPDQSRCPTTTSIPFGCPQNNPTISVSPSHASANLGDIINFTATVTNNDDSSCKSTTFITSGSNPSFKFLNVSINLFNFTSNPRVFTLAPHQTQAVNFSYGTMFAFASNYSLNFTASDILNFTHSTTAKIGFNVNEAFLPVYFNCTAISNGYTCGFGYITNYLDDVTVLFLVSNARGKVISSGGTTSTFIGALSFNFYCSTYGPGTYTLSWVAYKASDSQLTTPIDYSTNADDKTLTC